MNEETLSHIEQNKEAFEMWIRTGAQLQYGMDVLKPIVPLFEERFPDINLKSNCKSCILDMLQWALYKLNESKTNDETKIQN